MGITTFWQDFCIADGFGLDAIRDTYNRAFGEWKENYIYLTELVIVLNKKLWEHFKNGNEDYALLYDELWKKTDSYAVNTLESEELRYYLEEVD